MRYASPKNPGKIRKKVSGIYVFNGGVDIILNKEITIGWLENHYRKNRSVDNLLQHTDSNIGRVNFLL